MADYKVEVDLSNLFDEMTIREQKSFLDTNSVLYRQTKW